MTSMMVMPTRQMQIADGIREVEQTRARTLDRSIMARAAIRPDVRRAALTLGPSFPPAPRDGGKFMPGARRVAQIHMVAPDERVFGRTLNGFAGLGNACTGTGAQVASAMIGAGGAVGTAYMQGQIGSQVQNASQSKLDQLLSSGGSQSGTAGLGDMTQQQRVGAAFSVLSTAITASWDAACQARQGVNLIGQSAQVGRDATAGMVTAVQQARGAESTVTDVPATTVTTSSAGAPAASTEQDDRKMLYIGGGIVLVAIAGLLLSR